LTVGLVNVELVAVSALIDELVTTELVAVKALIDALVSVSIAALLVDCNLSELRFVKLASTST
jgi:hypothetical protein